MVEDTLIPVKVQLEETNFKDMTVLFVKDTAPTTKAIQQVMGQGYGEMMQFIQQNGLRPLKFMGWYYSTQPPWPMDVAIEIDKAVPQLTGRIKTRIQPGGQVLIAHVWGPYDGIGQAYTQIQNWLKQKNRKAKSQPFEVYVNDPNTVKDPSAIQTDIYQPLE